MRATTTVTLALLAAAGAASAADFAPVGGTATLVVTYRLESAGKKQDKSDLQQWSVKRQVELSAELVAQQPTALSALQEPDAAQSARLQLQQAQVQKAHKQMAPMMASAEAIVAKCGDDEKCLERETMKMGAAMSSQQRDDALKVGRETAAVMKPDADRYQRWQGRTQKGSYDIEERWHVVYLDLACPADRCTHEMTRKGGGAVTFQVSAAMVEVDTQGAMLMQLPVPLGVLDYTETHTTNEPKPDPEHAPKGARIGQMPLVVTAGTTLPSRVKVPLKGGWRSQSGEQVLSLGAHPWHGAAGGPGMLVVRWRFTAQ